MVLAHSHQTVSGAKQSARGLNISARGALFVGALDVDGLCKKYNSAACSSPSDDIVLSPANTAARPCALEIKNNGQQDAYRRRTPGRNPGCGFTRK